ncbi:MAG: glycosyltransferase [Chloroflexi bacterium]|nr:glycosyltransferase [Chloroflexota bacterium]
MRALVAGWFSFEDGHATAGDLLTRDLVCEWLVEAGMPYDVAAAPPFTGGLDWRTADPQAFTHVVFVCGPFGRDEHEQEFLKRFNECRLIGMNLSMKLPLDEWNPFDFLIERNSSRIVHPDISFLSRQPHVPVIGLCLVEHYEGAPVEEANVAIQRLLESNEVAVVPIDTRLDTNQTGLRTPAEVESLLARMDVVVTTRLHGTALSLKNGVPVLAIDPEVGGWKIRRLAELVGWHVTFNVDDLDEKALQKALDFCLTDEARALARACGERASQMVQEVKREFIAEVTSGASLEEAFQTRLAQARSGKRSKEEIAALPLVSVVIPCYNQARFLGEAIGSVLSQAYPRIEVIVVDDGSTDHTAEEAARYPEVRYIRQENQGLGAARNAGLRESHGEILVFLDSDDRLLPEAVERGVHHLSNAPGSAFVSGRYRYIKEDGAILREYSQKPAETDPYASFLRGNYIGMHATVAYRREVLEAVGGFNPSLPACEDYDLYLRIARKYPVSVHQDLIADYRLHSQNMSRDPGLMLKTVLAVMKSNWDDVRANETYREAYWAGVRSWREYYSEKFFGQLTQQWSAGQMRQVLSTMGQWFRHAPYQFAGYTFWSVVGFARRIVKRILTLPARYIPAGARTGSRIPAKGKVQFGDFRRLMPISREFGFERGTPVDRYYIETFLARHASDIQGHVLEVGDDTYTRRFGGGRVTKKDILHAHGGNPAATIVADLARANHIPSNLFDCIILTQTLHLVYNVPAAIETLCRILKPGGVLLATFPGISQLSIDEWADSWYWSFTVHSAHRLFQQAFPAKNLEIRSYGNVLAATAFLQGLAAEELDRAELDHCDSHYQTLIAVRAVKPERMQK